MAVVSTPMRWAVPADGDRIAGYHHECWSQASAPILSPELIRRVQPRTELWQQWLAEGSGFTTVVAIDDDDQPIAHTTVNGHTLVHLFVDPPHWRKGLGRTLLAVGERLIRQGGHRQAELHTRVGNSRAIALYESAGWIMTDRTLINEDEGVPDHSYTEHVMLKDFDPPGQSTPTATSRTCSDGDGHASA
jgi:GNAT superfamily N-acetyltransferase